MRFLYFQIVVLLSQTFKKTMASIPSLRTFAAALTLCLFVINLNIETCSSQQLNGINDYTGTRAYTPDTGLLDFVYHNHDEMTRFLR